MKDEIRKNILETKILNRQDKNKALKRFLLFFP